MEGPDIIGDLRVTGAKHLKINFLPLFAFKQKVFYFCCLSGERNNPDVVQQVVEEYWRCVYKTGIW